MSGVMEKYEKIAAEEATQRTKHQQFEICSN